MMPKEKIAQLPSAPPVKRLKSVATPPLECELVALTNHCRSTPAFTPGVAIAAPIRMTTIMAKVNIILLRSSGILKMLVKAETMANYQGGIYIHVLYPPVTPTNIQQNVHKKQKYLYSPIRNFTLLSSF